MRGNGDAIAVTELIFWSEVTGEEMLSALGTAKARWLSMLSPMEKIHRAYITLLTFLSCQFDREKDREKRKTIQWVYKALASWEARLTIAGLVDILRDCFLAKNQLEGQKSPGKVWEALSVLKAGLEVLCQKQSLFAALLVQFLSTGVEGDPGETGTCLEEVLRLYTRRHEQKLHVRYSIAGGAVMERFLTLADIGGPAHVRAIFQRLSTFARESAERVGQRFPTAALQQEMALFEAEAPPSNAELTQAARALGSFFRMDPGSLRGELRLMWSQRNTIATPELLREPFRLWSAVLRNTADNADLARARTVIGAFLTRFSQSAVCERIFALVENLKSSLHDQPDGQLFDRYLWVMCAGQPLEVAFASGTLHHATVTYLEKERRFATTADAFYKHGKRMVQHRRKQRSDAGTTGIRRKRTTTKLHKHLHGLAKLRQLKRNPSRESEQPRAALEDAPAEVPVSAIEELLSPPRRRRRRASDDEGDETQTQVHSPQ